MQRDKFDDILQRKFETAETDISPMPWAKMERGILLAERESGMAPRRRPLNRLWKYAAAAVIVVTLGLGIYMIQKPGVEDIIATTDPTQTDLHFDSAISGGDQREIPLSIDDLDVPENAISKLFRSAKSVSVQTVSGSDSQLAKILASEDNTDLIADNTPQTSITANNNVPSSSRSPYDSGYSPYAIGEGSNYGYYDGWENFRGKYNSDGNSWVLSAYTGTLPSSQGAGTGNPPFNSAYSFNPQEAALVEANYTRNSQYMAGQNLSHKLPLAVGLRVRKNLTERFGVETGISYSYLESTAELSNEYNYKYKQKVQYIGIPLSVNYSLWRRNGFDVYLTGGIMVEKAISAKGVTDIFKGVDFMSRETETLYPKGLLWSANTGIGAGYDFIDNFGVYLETGVNYYLPNLNHPETYRTSNPWSFNLKAGLRVGF